MRIQRTRAELIVVGAPGARPIERALFGSTASYVVRHAACPVLVVRETEARRAARTGREAESNAVTAAR
jgi:nucleotide-binding universal stress UspA family protein